LTIQETYDARARVVKEQQELNDLVQARDGAFTPEEQEKWDKADVDFNAFTDTIKRAEELRAKEMLLDQRIDEHVEKTQKEKGAPAANHRASDEYRAAMRGYLNGSPGPDEFRAMQSELDVSGGYFTVSEQLASGIIQAVDNLHGLRSFATIHSLPTAVSLGAVSWDTDLDDPVPVGEIGAVTESTGERVGKRHLNPHMSDLLLKISNQLLRQSFIDIEGFLATRFAYGFNDLDDVAFMTGNGTAMDSLGLFTASAEGITTGRDFNTDMAVDNVSATGLIGAQMNQKAQYRNRPSTAWIFSRGGIRRIRQLATGDFDYIWRPGLTAQEPDELLGNQYIESENASDTWTTGLYVGIYGDLSFYWIAEVANMQLQRLSELYAENHQTGLLAVKYIDAMPVLEEAFTRIKLA